MNAEIADAKKLIEYKLQDLYNGRLTNCESYALKLSQYALPFIAVLLIVSISIFSYSIALNGDPLGVVVFASCFFGLFLATIIYIVVLAILCAYLTLFPTQEFKKIVIDADKLHNSLWLEFEGEDGFIWKFADDLFMAEKDLSFAQIKIIQEAMIRSKQRQLPFDLSGYEEVIRFLKIIVKKYTHELDNAEFCKIINTRYTSA